MKNRLRSVISIIFTAILTTSVLSAFAVTTSADAAPKEIEKIIIDYRSESALKLSGGGVYKHSPTAGEPDPYTGGKVSFSSEKSAMQVQHHVVSRAEPYRVMLYANKNGQLTSAYKYFVIVYQAKCTGTYDLTLWNTPRQGNQIIIKDDGTDTKGEWVVSDVFDISAVNDSGKGILQRWVDGNINTVSFVTTAEGCEFYIKEMSFFKSAEDARAYYATADLSKSPTPGVAPMVPAASASYGQFLRTTAQTIEETTSGSSGTTVPESSTVEPYVMNLRSYQDMVRSGVEWYYHDGNQEGKRREILNAGDDNSYQLLYAPGTSFAPYRGMLRFKKENTVTTDYKWARLVYKVIDNEGGRITIMNNGGAGTLTVVSNTKESNGEWTVSAPFDLTSCKFIDRFISRMHVTIQYTGTNPDAKVYLKEMVLFGSKEQAYEYYGDSADNYSSASVSTLTFGKGGNAAFASGATFGVYTVNTEDNTLDITYAESTNFGIYVHYMSKLKFRNSSYDVNNIYTRILYAADNPEGVTDAKFYLQNDASNEIVCVANNVNDTNGEFVLSDVNCLSSTMPSRLISGLHCSLYTNVHIPGGEYRIKAIYFFPTREMAENFSLDGGNTELTVAGNSIENYRIVVNSDYPASAAAATELQKRVHKLTGFTLPIVNDNTPVSEYEIVIGENSRTKSTAKFNELQSEEFKNNRAITYLDGSTLVFVSEIPAAVTTLVENFNLTHLYEGSIDVPEKIDITSTVNSFTYINPYGTYNWGKAVNVADPEMFKYNFDFDEGYFVEENGLDNFEYYNGTYRTKSGAKAALSFIHVYERDVEFSVDMKYTTADSDGEIGIMTRYCADDAWVKAGYDFEEGEWFIEFREGFDFYTKRIASMASVIEKDIVYNLSLKVDEDIAEFYVNGVKMLEAKGATHITPGRVAIYADGAAIVVDNAKLTLMNGEGTIWKNAAHTKLPHNSYIEGGSVYEMNDGALIYQHSSGTTYKSLDNGVTWTSIEAHFPSSSYPNIIRLNNGDWLQIFTDDGFVKSRTSSDDGKTWIVGGNICASSYNGALAGNMNDKLTVAASGRIFYSQSYEHSTGINGRKAFCEFYYSDDNGNTWTKSETDSWEIEGNEKSVNFGECKLLECSDGTIRVYNSWSDYGCIVYSESNDGGKTFGPLVKMTDFPTSRASMQFVRDTYADNDTTYYMVWVNNGPISGSAMPRSRLTLAKSTDGKEWTVLGDVWRWESGYTVGGAHINHIVNPFIKVTENHVVVGSGISEYTKRSNESSLADYHQSQRQHIWSIPKTSLEAGKPLNQFVDVDTNDSYYDAVKFAVDNKLFNGTSENTFAPNTVMDRAMFVTVLGRLDGADVSAYATPTFDDVESGKWYTSYVEWAAANKIVNGLGNGIYGITNEITVEQACTILYRYSGGETSDEKSCKAVADFSDGECVSSWAVDAVEWAVENGVYDGVGSSLSPSCAAPRWLVATMFANYGAVFSK